MLNTKGSATLQARHGGSTDAGRNRPCSRAAHQPTHYPPPPVPGDQRDAWVPHPAFTPGDASAPQGLRRRQDHRQSGGGQARPRRQRSTLAIALLLAFAGGFVLQQTYSQIMHTANNALAGLADQAAPMALLDGIGPVANRAQSKSSQQAIFLIRATLLALNDANRTGNYSVLRDLAGPRFQQRNSLQQLAETFAPFRQSGVDLSRVGMIEPEVSLASPRDGDGVLEVRGHLPGEPGLPTSDPSGHRLNFAFEFEPVLGHWRLLTLSLRTDPPAAGR
jgi:hypothetical protein